VVSGASRPPEHKVHHRAIVVSIVSETPRFGAITNFEGDDATVSLRGSVENLAAFELGAILDAVIDRRPRSMVLDLAELEFMGAAGLVAVSNAEKRLAALGIRLLIQSPSALVNRLLGIMELTETSRLERAFPEHRHLGPEQEGKPPATSHPLGSNISPEDLRRVTAMPADPDVVDGALRLIVELALMNIVGADGVSVSLVRHGTLSTVAASDHTIMAMDRDQYLTGEGPCVDASVKGHWFHAESLDTETRWPAFTPRARELGIRAILSSPLRAFDVSVGALNIYSRTAETFEIKDQEIAAVFAEKASLILSDARAGVSDTQVAFRFQEALRSRKIITLAQGILMEREGMSDGEAFVALLRLSLCDGEPLRARAAAIVRSSHQPEVAIDEELDA
jgi:anti-anti-sigma factor